MNKISKDRVLAALVRTFFKYFLTGMMEGKDLNDTKAYFEDLQSGGFLCHCTYEL